MDIDVSRWLYTWIGDSMISDVEGDESVELKFELSQNYPNPFNPSTTINYSVPTSGLVTLKVYNILGQEVKTLVNTVQNAGFHNVSFDASTLSSGVYIYRLSSGNFVNTKKMILLK
ncbi:MAG: T9SS type A sorting domain-containing protein [Melioribacteraceae bacterium]|nr:T9SS type A sorting domain-containing protein [Melioribacteraceae bacterium]